MTEQRVSEQYDEQDGPVEVDAEVEETSGVPAEGVAEDALVESVLEDDRRRRAVRGRAVRR